MDSENWKTQVPYFDENTIRQQIQTSLLRSVEWAILNGGTIEKIPSRQCKPGLYKKHKPKKRGKSNGR